MLSPDAAILLPLPLTLPSPLGSFNWETNRDFQLTDPTTRQNYESSGRVGNSRSFGGGSGRGGGGGGGSW